MSNIGPIISIFCLICMSYLPVAGVCQDSDLRITIALLIQEQELFSNWEGNSSIQNLYSNLALCKFREHFPWAIVDLADTFSYKKREGIDFSDTGYIISGEIMENNIKFTIFDNFNNKTIYKNIVILDRITIFQNEAKFFSLISNALDDLVSHLVIYYLETGIYDYQESYFKRGIVSRSQKSTIPNSWIVKKSNLGASINWPRNKNQTEEFLYPFPTPSTVFVLPDTLYQCMNDLDELKSAIEKSLLEFQYRSAFGRSNLSHSFWYQTAVEQYYKNGSIIEKIDYRYCYKPIPFLNGVNVERYICHVLFGTPVYLRKFLILVEPALYRGENVVSSDASKAKITVLVYEYKFESWEGQEDLKNYLKSSNEKINLNASEHLQLSGLTYSFIKWCER